MDLREQLEAAVAEHTPADAPAAAVAAPEPIVVETAPVAAEPPVAAEEPAANAGRDEKGRFAPKAAQEGAELAAPEPPKPVSETEKPAGEGPQTEATRIPPSLSAAVKSQWQELPQTVRDEFARLEDTFQKGKAEWGTKGQRLNRFDEILGPHKDKWAFAGLDEFSGVQTLLAAQNILERNPVEGLVHIARSYSVSPQQLAQALGLSQASAPQLGSEGPTAPTAQPDLSAALQQHLQPVLQRFQTLETQLTQQSQASEAAQRAEAQATVDAFRNDPKNLYFENVRSDVARLIETGAAATISDAYDMAIWASSEIRPLLLKAQQAEQAKAAAEERDRAKAVKAQAAAGSVTGSPAPGAQALNGGPRLSLRDELEAARQSASAQL